MSQALYRKYRSRSFDEVIGQDHITNTLQKALKNGQLSHAYLFTGPRGIGKTSVARLLAYAANGIDYDDGGSHLDIIEIDGASNRRIEEVRDLRDKARILPSSGKYKVYIIDEVHMLTREAFNALLKTLEEPPEHCIFILATTEAHKLPKTIVSRTQRFSFRPIDTETLAKHLEQIAKKEKIDISKEALELIAEHGDGSFRDSISLLDQLGTSRSKISLDSVNAMLGLAPVELTAKILDAVEAGDSIRVIGYTQEAKELGVNAGNLAKALSAEIRKRLVGADISSINLLKDLIEVNASSMPYDRLEIALLSAAATNSPAKPLTKSTTINAKVASETKALKSPIKSSTTKKKISSPTQLTTLDWAKFQSSVKDRNSAMGLALKHSVGKLDGKILKLIFNFPLYKNKVAGAEGKQVIAAAIEEVLGPHIHAEFVLDKTEYEKTKRKPASKEQSIEAISNIFGGGEVVESSVS